MQFKHTLRRTQNTTINDGADGIDTDTTKNRDAVEHMAISEPLNAKTLVLSTVANEYEGRDEKWAAFGRIAPKISNQDWYGRRGYVVYKTVDNFWWEKDKNGKDWPATAVFMRKNIT